VNVAKAFKLKDHILPEQVEKIQGLFTPVHQKGQNKQKFSVKASDKKKKDLEIMLDQYSNFLY
jgi:hypothetical protein